MTDWWLIAFGVFFILAFFSATSRNRAWAFLWIVGAIGCIVAGANNIPFPTNTAEGGVALATALFIWVSPVVVVGFIIWLLIKMFAGAVASEVVRKQNEKQ
jgi:hypothetical protein